MIPWALHYQFNNSGGYMNFESSHRFFSAKGAAFESVKQTISEVELARIATAWFELSGCQLLQDCLAGNRVCLLIGHSEGGQNNMATVLKEFESFNRRFA